MRRPIFVRVVTDEERQTLAGGLRSADAFVLRRSQILLASARGERVPRIAVALSCDEQTVRDAIHAFNTRGLAALTAGSTRPHRTYPVCTLEQARQIRALTHQSPRAFGKPTSVWTLPLLAEVAFAQGLTSRLVTGEAIRQMLGRLGVRWRQAKRWICSPDPAYDAKKNGVTV